MSNRKLVGGDFILRQDAHRSMCKRFHLHLINMWLLQSGYYEQSVWDFGRPEADDAGAARMDVDGAEPADSRVKKGERRFGKGANISARKLYLINAVVANVFLDSTPRFPLLIFSCC
jgi:hypothetical protein